MTDDRSHFMGFVLNRDDLVPRVSHLPAPASAPGGGKMRDPGNEVETETAKNHT